MTVRKDPGFSLQKIKDPLGEGHRTSRKALDTRRRDELRALARNLDAMADQLGHSLDRPSPNVFDCEHIRADLQSALSVGAEDST